MTERKKKNTHAESCTQDIIECFQPPSIFKKKKRSSNSNSKIRTVGEHSTEVLEVEPSRESEFKEFSPNALESHAESGEKRSDHRKKRLKERKNKKKRRISFVADTESDSNPSYDITENENPNHQNHVEPNDTKLDEDGKKSKSKVKRKSSWDTSFADFVSPTKKQHADDVETSNDNLECRETTRSKKSLGNSASSCGSANVPVENFNTEPEVLREDKKCKKKEKDIMKKKSNSLLAMIHDWTSSSDDETKQFCNTSEETLNKGNLRNSNKSRFSDIQVTSNEEQEGDASKTKQARNSISISKCDKNSEDHRSESHKNDKKCSKENQHSFQLAETIKSEKLSANAATDCGSPNISVKDIKTEPDASKKDRKHKVKEKIKKKKSNTLLAIIHKSSSSESDDETKQIDDSFSSEESLNKGNLKKSPGSRARETLATSSEEEEDQASNKKPAKNPLAESQEFDLDAEAKDLEEMIIAMEEKEQLPKATLKKLHGLRITLEHAVPPQHQIETCAGSRGPTPMQKKLIEKFGPIKYGKFTPEEDNIIVQNWKSFCKLHNWDPKDVQPFLYMRHRSAGFITKFSERQKFVQFLANGLPWRLLYHVYWRFRNIYQPHIQTRYTEEEDKLIIAHMENSSSIHTKNMRKFSQLAKILNRTRDSVWRRYRLINKKRNPHQKIQWNMHLVKKLIKNLMQATRSEDVNQLKNLDIPFIVWKKLAEKFELDEKDLKQFWQTKLHMQLFCKEPIYLNDVKIKLIEYFYATGVTEQWEIEWSNVAKHFDGMTSTFLSQIFGGLVHDKKFEDMKFSEIIEYLHEVKKPQLQQAPKDKCLPKIVFKNGNVKLLDAEAKKQRKRKP